MLRAIALLLLAAAMLVAPLGARDGAAMASAPPSNHHGMSAQAHCAPAPDTPQPDDRAPTNCCTAMCSAVAPLPTAFAAPHLLTPLPPVAAPAPLRAAIPAELPTPPPRAA